MAARSNRNLKANPIPEFPDVSSRLDMVTELSGPALKAMRSSLSLSETAEASRSAASRSTCNTLSMVSTPWSTESWCSLSDSITDLSQLSQSTSYTSWTDTLDSPSTLSVNPRSTSTTGVPTRTLASISKTTVTIYSLASTPCYNSHQMFVSPIESESERDTLSSWTLETFTSTGLISTNGPQPVKARFPWSPATQASVSDYYPSSLDTLGSRKGSRVSIMSKPSPYKMEVQYPINYLTYNTRADDQPALQWTLANENGIPVIC
ncbi:unnamed protein product [Chrysodeixis includens]|uniref:Uncharacterized protein n=1 Tax=Chrysodeixis includens TaxID=689277 RepID=A0A9P0BS80_CHRIL|nr:unnamed protein product [Chrysodeixis includens]